MRTPNVTALVRELVLRLPIAPHRRFKRDTQAQPRSDLTRIGTDYGGWTIPGTSVDSDSVIYCGGVGLDASFDLGLIERYGCRVHAFDPTPSTVQYVRTLDAPNFRFYPWALWSQDGEIYLHSPDYSDSNFSATNLHHTSTGFTAPCRSLESIMEELGHDRIDLLKLDIEGAEYTVLDSLTVRPQILCIEFHKHGSRINEMIKAVRQLRSVGYIPVDVDGYNVTLVMG